jgi:ABC-type transport system involved in multi-copper enzyme maturation permease subunit
VNWEIRSARPAFYYYGSTLLNGLQLTSVLGLIAVAAVALGIGAMRFARKDIAV